MLVKLLLSHTQSVPNVPIDALYDEVVTTRVPVADWPNFVYQKFCATPEMPNLPTAARAAGARPELAWQPLSRGRAA